MARLARALALAGLVASAIALPAVGKVINVTQSSDSHNGACPGASCNLRAAWNTAKLGDTILLGVDPVMTLGPLESPMGWNSTRDRNGSVTLMGPPARGAVIKGGTRFLTYDGYPYRLGLVLGLVIKNIEFTGFNFLPDGKTGGIICISSAAGLCSQPYDESKRSLAATQGASGLTDGNHYPDELGSDTRYGNWSQLRRNPVLVVENCVFRDNTYTAAKGISYGSMISILAADSELPVVINATKFVNNTILGVTSIGSAISSDTFGTRGVALMISDCTFAQNLQGSIGGGEKIPSVAGPVVGVIGPVSISGSTFVRNTLGPCRAAVSVIKFFHAYIFDSSFIDNSANSQNANSPENAGVVIGGWIVLKRVTMALPTSVPPIATSSTNDQYMHECALVSNTGKAVLANGYQIYNRNPIYTNLVNGTGSLGFADCAQAAGWLPCRPGTECTNLRNTNSQVVGYACSE